MDDYVAQLRAQGWEVWWGPTEDDKTLMQMESFPVIELLNEAVEVLQDEHPNIECREKECRQCALLSRLAALADTKEKP